MSRLGWPALTVFFLVAQVAHSRDFSSCTDGAKTFLPCDLKFSFQRSELPSGGLSANDDVLSIEFRSPSATTYLLRAFSSAPNELRVRFTPTEPGTWTTRISSVIQHLDGQEASLSVTSGSSPGLVSIANLRHWKTTDKKPHLWLGVEVPLLTLDSTSLGSWLDGRKRDGFTHIRVTLLTGAAAGKQGPDPAYFTRLDDQIAEIAYRGFTLDLILADEAFLKTGSLQQDGGALLRYLISRYGALNATWQGITRFETQPQSRELLRAIGESLRRYDPYNHPRSTDAVVSSSPLLGDGWANFLVEASPHPEVGAVERQFTQVPQVHIVTATDPAAFREEVWTCTANGEYPTVSYASLQNEANVRAVQVWAKILAGTRHWEFEPYFDVSGARAVGLQEVEYLAYAAKPGIVEISLPRHKYNPIWINPATGEELELKDYKGEVLSRQTPDNLHDWILQVPRNGHKESMRSYRFESVDPPVQEAENDPARLPFSLVDPQGDGLNPRIPPPYLLKLTKSNRATRSMQYLIWGEAVGGTEGLRLLGIGPSGTLQFPPSVLSESSGVLNLRVQAINANGKAYELDRVYKIQ